MVYRKLQQKQMKVVVFYSSFTRTRLMTIAQSIYFPKLPNTLGLEVFFHPKNANKTSQQSSLHRTCAWRKPKIWRFQKWLSLVSRPNFSQKRSDPIYGFGWFIYLRWLNAQLFWGGKLERSLGVLPRPWFTVGKQHVLVHDPGTLSPHLHDPLGSQCLARTQDIHIIHIRYTLNNNNHNNLQAHRIHLWYICQHLLHKTKHPCR